MDAFDRQILKSLQENCRVSTEELGNKIGLSATACQRRIKKLRKAGVIHKEVAVLDGISLGGHVTIIVELTMKQGNTMIMDKVEAQMLANREVQQCYYVTGSADFFVIVIVENMLEYEQLARRLFSNNNDIQKYNSTVVMKNVKVGLDIPI